MRRREARLWWVRGAIATALLVPLLLWVSGCWLFNVPPDARFTISASVIEEGQTITFSAILSSDEDGIIARFEWDFGDGASATGESVSHKYNVTGSFTVVLRVTDDDGATATAQKVITVNPADENGGGTGGGPTASFTATPLTGDAPLTVTFNASESSYAGHAITAYFWDFGDGSSGTGITTTHTYAPTTTRSYNVVLRVIASDNEEATATKTITALVDAPSPGTEDPTASFTTAPNKVVAPKRIVCDGGNSEATAGRTLTEWIWRFGDGTSPRSLNNDDPIEHRYVTDRASETFTITLIVIDDEDGTDTSQRTVTVENKQPIAGFEIDDLLGGGGDWVAGDVTFPDDGDPDLNADSATVWIRSVAPDGKQGTTPTTNDEDDPLYVEPDPKTGAPGNYDDHNLCYDPEGQGWSGADPDGFPNSAWGIEWYKVNWGDGTTEYYSYVNDGPGLLEDHLYTGLDVGANTFAITVTAIDFLGAETNFSREITIDRES